MNSHNNQSKSSSPFQYSSASYQEQHYGIKHDAINGNNRGVDMSESQQQDQQMNGVSEMTDAVVVHPKGDWTYTSGVVGNVIEQHQPDAAAVDLHHHHHPELLQRSSNTDSSNQQDHYTLLRQHSGLERAQDASNYSIAIDDANRHHHQLSASSVLNPQQIRSSHHSPLLTSQASPSSFIPVSQTAQYASTYGYSPSSMGYAQQYHQLGHHQAEPTSNAFSSSSLSGHHHNLVTAQSGYARPTPTSRQQASSHFSAAHHAASTLLPNVQYGCFAGQSCYPHPSHSGYLDYSAFTAAIPTVQHRSNQTSNNSSDALGHGRAMTNTTAFTRVSDTSSRLQSVPHAPTTGTVSAAPALLPPTLEKPSTNQPTAKYSSRSSRTSTSPQVKRPRGRPRKHPLPFSASLTQQQQQQWDNYQHQQTLLIQQQGESFDNSCASSLAGGQTAAGSVGFAPSYHQQSVPQPHETIAQTTTTTAAAEGTPKGEKKNKKTGKTNDKQALATTVENHDKVDKYLQQRGQLYSNDVFNQLQVLEYKLPQFKIGEDFYGFGGPFSLLSLGQRIQNVIEGHQKLQEQKKAKDSSSELVSTVLTTPQDVLRHHLHSESNGFLLNESFVFSSFSHKLPIRDLTISRHHMAALCDDSTVFLYRHKTHPLVRTNVSKWEKIDAFDGLSIVCTRLVSAHLSPNWRQRYHENRRALTIQRIRQELTERNVRLPPPPTSTDELITHEELEVFVSEDPDGILCCSYEELDPDWLPEPAVLAAIDSTGSIKIVRCSGYYNYPIAVKREGNWETGVNGGGENRDAAIVDFDTTMQTRSEKEGTNEEGENRTVDEQPELTTTGRPKRLSSIARTEQRGEVAGLLTKTTTATTSSSLPTTPTGSYQIKRNLTRMDIVEKPPDLTVHLKQDDRGIPAKVKGEIQDLALGELTEDLLVADSSSEVPMIVYVVANNEHSALVKGKNVYIRFKNFPTALSKIYCGPLGHVGLVLLSNGTVWSWKVQAGTKEGSRKFGVAIHQVNGSLQNRIVIDFMAIGAEFIALTSDGLIHEWNSYEPYLNRLTDIEPHIIVPSCIDRPNIPEPIEWTPNFQKQSTDRDGDASSP